MRYSTPIFAALVALMSLSTAHAEDFNFISASGYEIAQREAGISDEEQERRDREEERRDREQERRDRAEARREREAARHGRDEHDEREVRRVVPGGRFWVGVGAGLGAASVKVRCDSSSTSNDCTEGGSVGTYSANVTVTGPFTALRLRGIRQQDKGNDARTPYEEAALVGSRFGSSNWYGLVGVGRILHADDDHPDDTHGFAWEILFAPSSYSATGLELGFQGELGEDVDFVAFNLGMRFGQLR